MKPDYWLRQPADQPLYPQLLWSRPETRQHAGKLLIVGGHAQSFAAPASAYAAAQRAGIGTARVVLPDSLRRTVGQVFPDGEYAPSTPSGSFAQTALAELLDMAHWADAVLLAGDFGHNSETAILLESFTRKWSGYIALVGDSLDPFIRQPTILPRPQTLVVPDFSQLQKLSTTARSPRAITSKLDLLRLVEITQELASHHAVEWLFVHNRTYLIAAEQQVSTTTFSIYKVPDDVAAAATAVVWRLQNPSRPLAALTTSLVANEAF